MKKIIILSALFSSILLTTVVFAFDHQHKQWEQILKQSVHLINAAHASRFNYKAVQDNPIFLNKYLLGLSSVTENDFTAWTHDQQKAFLINAYNAFTIQLILTRYPDLNSIKELGSFFSNPWKKKFFTLLGKSRSLDDIEHGMLRRPGVYNDPYIHFAVVCASISCPALKNEAYIADRLEQQLQDSVKQFLGDKSRNRFNTHNNKLEVSKIFDWYEEDFQKGYRGLYSIHDLFSRYAAQLSDNKNSQQYIRRKTAKVIFLEYNWKLNDVAEKDS